ncbi:MAG: hypothetical protein U0350_42050 [Caldilineaceae bacterium]
MKRRQILTIFFGLLSFLLLLADATTVQPAFAQTSPTPVTIPEDTAGVKIDANCDTKTEYTQKPLTYTDTQGLPGAIYLKHDNANLYVCIVAPSGSVPARFFGVYLDTNDDRASFPLKDDFFLRANAETTATATFQGTGIGTVPYAQVNVRPDLWEAKTAVVATPGAPSKDIAEYRIARALISPSCSTPFGLAIYHQQVDDIGSGTYGVPAGQAYNFPAGWLQATLANPRCIRVVTDRFGQSTPATSATVYRTSDQRAYTVDGNGFLVNSTQLTNGDGLWAMQPVTPTKNYTVYYTSGASTVISDAAFGTNGVMTLVVSKQKPLLVQALNVSAQWYVEGDPNRAAWLRAQITHAADALYAFTNRQFTLGTVRIQQSYDGWDQTNLKLHLNNTFQPRANIGGIVTTATVDLMPTVAMTYTPGNIFMGSYWNRYGKPPGELILDHGAVVPTSTMQFDWSLALAHELSHYLLFEFDSYTGVDGQADQELAKICTGSAMGDVYTPSNQGFIFDPVHWKDKCSGTEAYHVLHGRTEWQTLQLWYPWSIIPNALTGSVTPPVNLTNVVFAPPSTPPGALAASQIFNLDYQDNEKSSGEARAFILRNNRVYEQGKPPKNATQVELIDAELGDRLCVYDINDHAENGETTRHQFGCETIQAGDSDLAMTKNNSWGPVVRLQQTGSKQLTIAITHPLTSPVSAPMLVRLYPEDGTAFAPVPLVGSNGVYTTVLNLSNPVPPLYAQIWISETTTNPLTRREVIVDRGTGGSGAFGPLRIFGGVLIVSSDGNASFESDQPLNLSPGQAIAWQSMPGTPPLPVGKNIIGQSYRLDAYPSSLVTSGKVRIQYQDLASVVQAASNNQTDLSNVAVYFWNGSTWRRLTTTISTPVNAPDGVKLATAPSQGIGVYAILGDPSFIFLPLIRR